jgi:hypothetical protein
VTFNGVLVREFKTSWTARVRAAFDARLAHEAWHAYADRRLRSPRAPGLPAWLDEGIAQVVETSPIEAGAPFSTGNRSRSPPAPA